MRFLLGILTIGIAAASVQSQTAGAQTLYRWVDKEGGVHYTQQPPMPGTARSVQERKELGVPPAAELPQAPFALQLAMKSYPVTLYTSPSCTKGCPEARELLKKRGVPFREVIVEYEDTNALLKKATGDSKVPSVTVGTAMHIGYQAEDIHKLLDTAGYPKEPAFVGKPPELPPLPELAPTPPAGAAPASDTAPAQGAAPAPQNP